MPWGFVMGEVVCPVRYNGEWHLLVIEMVSQMSQQRRKDTGIVDLFDAEAITYTESREMWCIAEASGINAGLYNPTNGSYCDVEYLIVFTYRN